MAGHRAGHARIPGQGAGCGAAAWGDALESWDDTVRDGLDRDPEVADARLPAKTCGARFMGSRHRVGAEIEGRVAAQVLVDDEGVVERRKGALAAVQALAQTAVDADGHGGVAA